MGTRITLTAWFTSHWQSMISDATTLQNFHSTLTLTSSNSHLTQCQLCWIPLGSRSWLSATLFLTVLILKAFPLIWERVAFGLCLRPLSHQAFWLVCLAQTAPVCCIWMKASQSCSRSDWWSSPNCWPVAWSCWGYSKCPVTRLLSLCLSLTLFLSLLGLVESSQHTLLDIWHLEC